MNIDSEWRLSGERGWIIIDGVRMEASIEASHDESMWTWNLTFNGDDHACGYAEAHSKARQRVYRAAKKLADAVNEKRAKDQAAHSSS